MSADQAVFFDLDGTLVQFTRQYGDVLAETFEAHLDTDTVDANRDAMVETYDEAFYEAFRAFAPDPYREGMEAALEAADAVGEADPDVMVDVLRDVEYASTAVDPALPDALATLGEDASLGVLTNGLPAWQAGKLERTGLSGQFDAVVTSYEAGAHKPDPEPFALAAERLPAAEYAMVGDDDADVDGARAAGWVPIRYEDADDGPAFWETVGALL